MPDDFLKPREKEVAVSTDTALKTAIETIDNNLGEGYAKRNPDLIGQIVIYQAKMANSPYL